MNATQEAKIVSMVLLLAGTLFLGLIPIKLSKRCDPEKNAFNRGVVSFLLCFGGGVLLATCFIHILPEVNHALAALPGSLPLPLAELSLCAGFFLVYFIEELVHYVSDKSLNPTAATVHKCVASPPSISNH